MNLRPSLRGNLSSLALAACVVVLAVLRSARAIGAYSHNDHMYLGSAVLALRYPLYTDAAFVQTPLSIFVYQLAYLAFGEERFFGACRAASVILTLLAVGFLSATTFTLAGRRLTFGLLAAVTLLTNGVFMSAAFEAGNYSLSLALASAAVFCLSRPSPPASRLLAGVLLGLSISAKLSFLFVSAGLSAACFVWERRARDLLSLIGGIALGTLPTLYFLARGPDTFLFLTYTFHHLTNVHRGVTRWGDWRGIGTGMTKIAFGLAPLLALTSFALLKAKPSGAVTSRRGLLAVVIVLTSSFAGALSPMVFFKTYWNLPVGLVAVACLWGIARADAPNLLSRLLLVASVGLCLVTVGWDSWNLAHPRDARAEVRAAQRAFKDQAGRYRACVTDVLTPVAPLTLGSGVPLAPGSSGGPFLFRLDDVVAQTAARYRRFTDFRGFLGPHTALFVGYYPEEPFEGRMAVYAERHGFLRQPAIRFRERDLVLYVPESCAAFARRDD